MIFNIKHEQNKVIINVNEVGDKKEKLLQNFNKCKEGSCECPTNEYSKLENLDVRSDQNEITLTLTLKEKERLNEEDISDCIDYSIAQ